MRLKRKDICLLIFSYAEELGSRLTTDDMTPPETVESELMDIVSTIEELLKEFRHANTSLH